MPDAQGSIFPQKVIALIWDFDKTLIPGYMQAPLFKRFGVDAAKFWEEVEELPRFYREHDYPLFASDVGYLSHILTYVREGKFKGLNNRVLRELGAQLEFYPGLPEFFPRIKRAIEEHPDFKRHEIKLEHYVVSTGLRQMIMGSAINPYVDGIWACEFLGITASSGFIDQRHDRENADEAELRDVAYAIDHTTKTRAVFEINKGVNKHPEITVNATIALEHRRVPIEHMVYIADGPSDVPVFSIINQSGGKTFAVYPPDLSKTKDFRQALLLHDEGRVQAFGPADYQIGGHTERCLSAWVEQIAEKIAHRWQTRLGEHVGKPPQHIPEPSGEAQAPQAPATDPRLAKPADVDPAASNGEGQPK